VLFFFREIFFVQLKRFGQFLEVSSGDADFLENRVNQGRLTAIPQSAGDKLVGQIAAARRRVTPFS
jgi:hypothetical protein